MAKSDLSQLENIAKALRVHSLRATTQAGSGHPSSSLSAADLLAATFFHAMRFEPDQPQDPRADRFVLSKGHAAPLLWAVWAVAGFIQEKDLLTLREIDSNLEGHPTPRFPWVDVATGSLGQGLSVGCGMAINFRLDKSDAKTFVLLGDGECAEGSVWEAAGFAGYYKLNSLIALVDVNRWGQSQETMYQDHVEVYAKKFDACGWETQCIDGHDMNAIVSALDRALAQKEKPQAIIAKTIKGKGVSLLEGKAGWHGKALSKEDLAKALLEIGPTEPIHPKINPPTSAKIAYPEKKLEGVKAPQYKLGENVATRAAYGEALVKLGEIYPQVVVLDGDTKNSTFSEKFLAKFKERFIECFIAEQNMVGVALGLAARGKIPFASTFGAFMTRAFDQIRMAAISKKPIKLCGSHAGVSIGEDGPSQMALEDLAMMRTIPNMAVLYPSDAVASERLVYEAFCYPGMVYIRTQRPALPVLYPNDEKFLIGGSKTLRQSPQDNVTLVVAGVTLIEALKAYEILKGQGIFARVIDCYSIKPIDEKTLIKAAKETEAIITVEDHYPEGGLGDAVLSALGSHKVCVHKLAVNQIPRSGKPDQLLNLCGIDAQNIVKKVGEIL